MTQCTSGQGEQWNHYVSMDDVDLLMQGFYGRGQIILTPLESSLRAIPKFRRWLPTGLPVSRAARLTNSSLLIFNDGRLATHR